MKKILCLIDGLGSGGAQRQLVGLSALLKSKEYDVSLMWYHKISFFQPFLEEQGVRCIHLLPQKRFLKCLSIYQAIKREKPDIVIAYLGGPCIISCLLKIAGVKYKLIVSERNTTQCPNIREKIRFALYRFADAIVPNSYSQMRFLQSQYPYLANKITPITNFVDIGKYKPTVPWTRGKTFNILIVGRINPQKNVLCFMYAVAELKNKGVGVHFDWYGGKHDLDYHEKVNSLYKSLDISDMLAFYEPVQHIEQYYSQADAFCLPSLYEGFPNVICEAMSSGLPILCSNVCDNPDIVKDGYNGLLFDPNNYIDIADKITTLYNMEEDSLLEMRFKSRKIAIEKFKADVFVNKYLDLIEKL